jgi:hypothetical protein
MKKFLSLAGLCALMLGFAACEKQYVPLTAPTDLSQTNVTETTATLSWNAVAEADSYNVRLNDGGIIPVASNVYQAINLTPNLVYNWVVQAVRGDDLGPWSAMMSFTTGGGGGGDVLVPANLRTTGITTEGAVFNWDPVANATGYEVRFGDNIYPLLGTTYSVSGLEREATYTWTVRAVAGPVRSDWAPEQTFTTISFDGTWFGEIPMTLKIFYPDGFGDGTADIWVVQSREDTVIVVDNTLTGTGWVVGNLQIHAPVTGTPEVPDGTYIVDQSYLPGSVLSGYVTITGLAGLWVRRLDNDAIVNVPMLSGTVVSTFANGEYRMVIDAMGDNGVHYGGVVYGYRNDQPGVAPRISSDNWEGYSIDHLISSEIATR